MKNQNPYINIILDIERQKENLPLNLDNKPSSGVYYWNSVFLNLDAQLEHFQELSGRWESVKSVHAKQN